MNNAVKFPSMCSYNTGKTVPHPVSSINVTPGTTNVTISFTVPDIAYYAVETYSINYTDLELQITSTSYCKSTSARVQKSISLTDLEEYHSYSFIIVSTNCIGSTNTAPMNFTTLSSSKFTQICDAYIIIVWIIIVPDAPPINCTNTTFFSRNVTLSWIEPVRTGQNGRAVGYNLACNSYPAGIQSSTRNDTDELIDNQDLRYTLTNILPYTHYNCNLTFINTVGQGPPTKCFFTTAQDSKNNY